MTKRSGFGAALNGAAAIYFLGSVGIALAILYGLVVHATQLVPGFTWKIVAVLFSINVGIVIFRSLREKELTGQKGICFAIAALMLLLLQVGAVSEMSDVARSASSAQAGRLDDPTGIALSFFTTVMPCLMAGLGVLHSAAEVSNATRKRIAAERRRWPH